MNLLRKSVSIRVSTARWYFLFAAPLIPFASFYGMPKGFDCVHGSAALVEHSENLSKVQSSGKAIIHWEDFSISPDQAIYFEQLGDHKFVLNRVIGSQISKILGTLQSNGAVYLINPNGIFIGPEGRIETQGFIGSSLDILDQDFLAGKGLCFIGKNNEGKIIHQGRIHCPAGDVFLFAAQIENQGEIEASQGYVGLGAGSEIILAVDGHERIFIKPVQEMEGSIDHTGKIQGISVELQAQGSPYACAIRSSGEIEAACVVETDGRVFLKATEGSLILDGKIKASSVRATGEEVRVLEHSSINANLLESGGEILIGGDLRGENPQMQNAKRVYVEKGALLSANAEEKGAGGKVIVWSEEHTIFAGHVEAKGPDQGGFVEISGERLGFSGTSDLRSENGLTGTLLFDPKFIVIGGGVGFLGPTDPFASNVGGTDTFTGASLGSVIDTSAVILQANTDITINDTVPTTTAAGSLTLQAGRSILFTALGQVTLNSANFSATINENLLSPPQPSDTTADRDMGNAVFSMAAGSSLTTTSGNITVTYGNFGTPVPGPFVGYVHIDSATITSTSGTISISGQGYGGLAAAPDNTGITLEGSAQIISGSNAATAISLTGDAGGVTATAAHGILLDDSALIRITGDGNLVMNGSVPATATVGSSTGIRMVSGSTTIIESTAGAGSIIMTGSSASTDAVGSCHGLDINRIVRSTGTGLITLTGTGSPNSTGTAIAGISLDSGARIESSNGDISLTGFRGGTGAASNTAGIALTRNVLITATNSANINIDATMGSNPGGSQSVGLAMRGINQHILISAVDGDITINGIGSSGAMGALSDYGVWLLGASLSTGGGLLTTGSGNISVTGTSLSGNQATGIEMENSSVIALGTGNIDMTGTSHFLGGSANCGIIFTVTALVDQTIQAANGSITMVGTAGGAPGSFSNSGIVVSGGAFGGAQRARVQVNGSGNLSMTGTAAGSGGVGGNNGIRLDVHSQILSTSIAPNAGTITLDGTGGGTNVNNNGILMTGNAMGLFTGALVRSINGDITMTGQTAGNNAGCNGILVEFGADIESTGTADMVLTGTGGIGASDNNGIHVTRAGSTITSLGTGAITMVGTGGPGAVLPASQNQGVRVSIDGLISSVAGPVNITGTGNGNATGTNNVGIDVDSSGDILVSGASNLTLNGTGGRGTSNNFGIQVSGAGSSITSNSTGTANITGNGSTNATSATSNHGIQVDTSGLITASSGILNLTGNGGGNGLGGTNVGIQVLSAGDIVASGSATANIIGIGGNGGSNNHGIQVSDAGSTIDNASSNLMTATGTGGGNGTGTNNVGIRVVNDGDIRLLGSAPSVLIGNGGNGTTSNHGIQVTGLGSTIFSSGTSSLSLNGTGSGAVAATSQNHGIQLDTSGEIQTQGGPIVATGVGGGNGIGNTNIGIEIISGGQIESSSALGPLTLTGTGGSSTANNYGVHVSGLGSSILSTDAGLIQVNGNHGTATLEDVLIELSGSIVSTTAGNIQVSADVSDVLIRDGGFISSQDTGTVFVEAVNDVRLEGGAGASQFAAIILTNGDGTIQAGGDVLLQGGSGVDAYAQIGNDTLGLAPTADILVTAQGNVSVDGTNSNSYALIGHGNPQLAAPSLSGDITVLAFDTLIDGADVMGGGAFGFGQIGHVNSAAATTLTGNIFIDVRNDILITGGTASATAYARVGHGGITAGMAPTVSGNILMIADVDIILNSDPMLGQAQIQNLGPGSVICVVDDLFRTTCQFGPGQFILSADSLIDTTGGELRLYTVMPSQNTVNELVNGVAFVPGPYNVNTATETWSTYYPLGAYGGAAFNFYYKIPCIIPDDDILGPITDLTVDNSQLTPLLPNFLPLDYENYPYHPKLCIRDWIQPFFYIGEEHRITKTDCEPVFVRYRSMIFENYLK